MRIHRIAFMCALFSVVAGALGTSADTPPSKPAQPKAVARGIRWRSIVSGEAEAKKSGKPALYFFTAEWCGPCHLLREQVFSVPEVAAQVERDFVPILVEDRAREEGRNAPEMLDLADRYCLRGFPTLVVARPRVGTNVILEGWEGRGAATEFLKTGRQRFLAGEKKPGVKK